MQCIMLKAKLHRACVTHAELDYEGSCAIDGDLLDLAGIREYEQIQIYNVANGERFTTYAIVGTRGSGIIGVNGAAARLCQKDDLIIICAYGHMNAADATNHHPTVILVDEKNRLRHHSNISIPQ